MAGQPRGREKNITGQGKSVYKRGSGLGTGPVGNSGGYQGRPGTGGSHAPRQNGNPAGAGQSGTRASGRRSPLLVIILAAIALLGGGGAGLSSLLGGGDSTAQSVTESVGSLVSSSSLSGGMDLSALLGGISAGNTSTGWTKAANTGKLDTSVAKGARDKYVTPVGGGRDTVTLMVYMCGTDLESKSGMGTADLQEMAAATLGEKVNLLVYTGGCKQWQNSVISSSVNQIYKVEKGGLRCLETDMGSAAMTKPGNLSEYIRWCEKNYPADRYGLIFWDHGGGSLSGYGYDEKKAGSGSMTLKGIDEALRGGGVTFDFIGFDACLMATTENALMLGRYADYLIASEETEPGVGWYYTDWLTKLSANTSMSTIEIGKNICDDFVAECERKCPGQKTTLSVVDLAELEATAPAELKKFAEATSELIGADGYQTVASARSSAREFSTSKIDQVDLVSFAAKLNTPEANALSEALLGAVKYNRTGKSMTDAYGLSIFFPYQKLSNVDNAVETFDAIGMEDEYLDCIRQFAGMETAGQAAAGGTAAASPLISLLGGSYAGTGSADAISSVLSELMNGKIAGLGGSFLGKSLDPASAAAYLADHSFDASALTWVTGSTGEPVISLTAEQWALVEDLELNLFVDDGAGYIDLGLDNLYEFTDKGELLGSFDGTWLAINDQPVSYFLEDCVDDGENYAITGRVPVLLNGQRADLILVFDNENPYGYVAGARYDYRNGETETVAKSFIALNDGDTLDFLCDYYSYDGSYEDSYMLGDPMTVDGTLTISNVYLTDYTLSACYRFTDIYQQSYWTPELP